MKTKEYFEEKHKDRINLINKSAYPFSVEIENGCTYNYYGLTKRELFAAMFMQSLLSNPERYKYISKKVANGMSQEEASSKNAHKSVLLADALINELNKE